MEPVNRSSISLIRVSKYSIGPAIICSLIKAI